MIKRINDIINRNRSFLIASHERLDGDALGSELALYQMLINLGKKAVVYNQDKTPGHFQFLPGSEVIIHQLPDIENFDVAFVLDCSELERVGEEAQRIVKIKPMINIDHHVSNGGFCEVALIDPRASSTGELLFKIMVALDIELTQEMATNLYAAILTDTGGFCYGNTTTDSFIAASRLVEKGASPQWISENIYENNPLVKIRLLTKVLETLTFDCNGKVGSMVVLKESLEKTGALPEHTDGFVDLPRTVQGVEVSILFSELSEQDFKLSMRSKGRFNVERIAKRFGGGGHINAAACRIKGDVSAVKRLVLAEIEASCKQ
jgi:bifunctional oligoribonuclease and PAP phosphatase NrnA